MGVIVVQRRFTRIAFLASVCLTVYPLRTLTEQVMAVLPKEGVSNTDDHGIFKVQQLFSLARCWTPAPCQIEKQGLYLL